MAKLTTETRSYGFDPQFERTLGGVACLNQNFYFRVGHAVDTARLKLPEVKTALSAAQQVAANGQRPTKLLIRQHLQSQVDAGKIDFDDRQAAFDLIDAIELNQPNVDDLVGQVLPVLRRAMMWEIATETTLAAGRHEDIDTFGPRMMTLVGGMLNLGASTAEPTVWGHQAFDAIDAAEKIKRLPTGISSLDFILNGGVERGGLAMLLGDSNSGKSMGLSQILSHLATTGVFGLYATLEMPDWTVWSRILAPIIGVPISAMEDNKSVRSRSREMFREMREDGRLGPIGVRYFTEGATTPRDIEAWVRHCELERGRPVDVLVVDYADCLVADGKVEGKGQYEAMRKVYRDLRNTAREHNLVCWTASQATRPDGAKRLGARHASDSMHKVRVCDVGISINPTDDGKAVDLSVFKRRIDKSGGSTGPLMSDTGFGKLVTDQMYEGKIDSDE